MLSRVTRGLFSVSLYTNKRKQLPVNQPYYCLARQLSQSAVRYGTNQAEDTTDLMFDLGGAAGANDERTVNKPKAMRQLRKTTSKQQSAKIQIPANKQDRSFEQLKYHDLALDLTYVKLPFNHPELAKLMLMLKSRKYREQHKLLLVEGRRLTLEAVDAGLTLRYLLFSNVKQVETIRREMQKAFTKRTEFIRVPHNDLSFWSTLTTCPGLITVFDRPADMNTIWENRKQIIIDKLMKQQQKQQQQQCDAAADASEVEATDGDDQPDESCESAGAMFRPVPITVICDQVREPNNLGGIIRTCAALPCSQVILLKGCADPWDVKALRGGCGAQFRVPIIGPIEWEELQTHLPAPNEMSVFIADNQSASSNEMQVPRDKYELNRKQNNAPFFQPKAYDDISFHNCKHIAVIIGGETEGVSSHALDFMKFVTQQSETPTNDDDPVEVNRMPANSVIEIPLGNGVESLNASVATGILLFEMRKQLLE